MIPIIDITPLVSRGAKQESVVNEIRDACETVGFFYVIGHGISLDIQTKVSLLPESFLFYQST